MGRVFPEDANKLCYQVLHTSGAPRVASHAAQILALGRLTRVHRSHLIPAAGGVGERDFSFRTTGGGARSCRIPSLDLLHISHICLSSGLWKVQVAHSHMAPGCPWLLDHRLLLLELAEVQDQ